MRFEKRLLSLEFINTVTNTKSYPGGHKALPYIGFKAFSVGAGFIPAS